MRVHQPVAGATDRGRADESQGGRRWPALALLCAAQFVGVMNFQIVAIALPMIGQGLGFSSTGLQWVISANALAYGGFVLLSGRAADLFGHRRLFRVGLALYAVASLACGLALSPPLMIAARTAQGLGTALFTPAALALLTDTFPDGPERNRALGLWGGAGPLGGIVSVLVGGFLATHLGWPWVFFLSIPIAVVAFGLAPALLPEHRSRQGPGSLDLAGAITGTAGIGLFVYGLTRVTGDRFSSLVSAVPIALALGLLATFVLIEARSADPILPLRIFRRRLLTGANIVAVLHGAATNTPIFFFALYMQQVRDASPLATGLAFLPCNLAVVAGAALGARLASRAGYWWTMAAGMGIVAVALPVLARMSIDGGYAGTLLPGLILWGSGLGVAQIGIIGAATTGVEATARGLAAGLLNTSAQIGTALGLACLVAVATARTEFLSEDAAIGTAALVDGYRWAFYAGASLATLGVLVAFVIGRGDLRSDDDFSRNDH